MTLELPLADKDIERVGLKLFELVKREIESNRQEGNLKKLMLRAMDEAGY
jgi:hypothetical protein